VKTAVEVAEGRLLASDEAPEVLEGDWPHRKVALIELADRAEALRWATSPQSTGRSRPVAGVDRPRSRPPSEA
jgi:uncharacterized protein (DUF1330 family)